MTFENKQPFFPTDYCTFLLCRFSFQSMFCKYFLNITPLLGTLNAATLNFWRRSQLPDNTFSGGHIWAAQYIAKYCHCNISGVAGVRKSYLNNFLAVTHVDSSVHRCSCDIKKLDVPACFLFLQIKLFRLPSWLAW